MLRRIFTRFCAFNNSSCLRKSNVVITLPLLRFSTSGESQSSAQPTFYHLLVHKHHFSPQSASKIASAVARLRNPERSDAVLSFLKASGFSNSQLEKMVNRRPQLLSLNLDNIIKPQLKIFHDFGLSSSDITKIISLYPRILALRLNNRLMPSLSTLKSLFGAHGFNQLLGASGWFLTANLDDSLVPNVEFLKKCGISMDRIIQLARSHPRTLLCKPEDMKKFVERADDMGVNRSSKVFISAVGLSHTLLNKSLNIPERTFRELGLSDDEIAATFRKFPRVFGLSEKTLKHKLKTYGDLGFSENDVASALRKSPQLFGFSVETLKLRVLTFKEMGFSDDDITATFRRVPTVFGLSDKNWKLKVKMFEEMGFSDDSIAAALRKSPQLFCLSDETWKLKVRTLKEMGFSDDDIVVAFNKCPQLFSSSEEKIKRTIEVLLANGKFNMSCIIRNPVALTYSIEKRYKPRLQILEMLEGKNLIQRWPPLSKLYWMTDQTFHDNYVAPFLDEIGDVYMGKSASHGKFYSCSWKKIWICILKSSERPKQDSKAFEYLLVMKIKMNIEHWCLSLNGSRLQAPGSISLAAAPLQPSPSCRILSHQSPIYIPSFCYGFFGFLRNSIDSLIQSQWLPTL